jgi:23S rRNA (guanine2445-N2)-methyltransferase
LARARLSIAEYEIHGADRRIEAGGVAGARRVGREQAQTENAGDFFAQLAAHWKKSHPGCTACMLSPDMKLPSRMRLKESRRVPLWNGPIECRLFSRDRA